MFSFHIWILHKGQSPNRTLTCHLLICFYRLPIFQGATAVYVVPLVLMSSLEKTFCSGNEPVTVGKLYTLTSLY